MRFVLASQSPQRKKILESVGLDFEAIPADIDEHHAGYTKPHKIVESISVRKAEVIAEKYPKQWIIGSDTIVVLANGEISLKPENKGYAKKIIQSYRNSFCHVYSGLALVNLEEKVCLKGYEKSTIYFGDFTDQQIEAYLKIDRWKHSSGSLTIEEVGDWVKHIKGDYANILGLPVNLLKKFIQKVKLIN